MKFVVKVCVNNSPNMPIVRGFEQYLGWYLQMAMIK